MGPAGFPAEMEDSLQIRKSIFDTFVPRGFTVYDNAYSNYLRTVYSVPSFLDFTLYQSGTADQIPERSQRPYRLLNYWSTLGYRFHIYQNSFVPGLAEHLNPPPVKVTEYTFRSTGLAQTIPFSLAEKIRLLLGGYAVMNGFAHAALSTTWERTLEVGTTQWGASMSLEVLNVLERDIVESDVGSVFVVHLLVPHYAYIYRADGGVRSLEQLLEHAQIEGWSSSDPAYQQLAVMYSEQVRYLNKRLAHFFDRLQEEGRFDSSLIIVHGDHGLRMLELGPEDDSFFAYLQNYSTLMAVKHPGELIGRVDNEKAAVMGLLYNTLPTRPTWVLPHGLDDVYDLLPDGSFSLYPFLDEWEDYCRQPGHLACN
jgi:hypothetical protein